MQIVIDIDEDTYRYMQSRFKYQNKGDNGLSKFEEAGVAIKNGTILPKRHGRLIDANALKMDNRVCGDMCLSKTSLFIANKIIKQAKTIIEADNEV